MPKVIPNAKRLIMQEAKKILAEYGFSALSMKYVAEKCNMSVGTVYKYFKNNDDLAFAAMFDDWCLVTRKTVAITETCDSIADGFGKIYDVVADYSEIYKVPLRNFSDGSGNYNLPNDHHNNFVKQFGDFISTMFCRFGRNDLLPDTALYAEILLSSVSRSDISKSSLLKLIGKI